jgi:hypothetical protein
MTDQEALCSLRNWINCLDGPKTTRQTMMLRVLDYLEHRITELDKENNNLSDRLGVMCETAAKYRDLADQRLLNHLNIDEDHIIDIVNESLPSYPTNELGPLSSDGQDAVRIPSIPVEPIEFNYELTETDKQEMVRRTKAIVEGNNDPTE